MRGVSTEELVCFARGGLNLRWQLPVHLSKSRARLEVTLCNLWKLLRIFGEIGFVSVQ
jgi:hypothetical protein